MPVEPSTFRLIHDETSIFVVVQPAAPRQFELIGGVG